MRKVSRERVGKEMDGMFTGKNAKGDEALVLLGDLSLLDCIFSFPFLEEEGGDNGNGSGHKRIKKNDEKETNAEEDPPPPEDSTAREGEDHHTEPRGDQKVQERLQGPP